MAGQHIPRLATTHATGVDCVLFVVYTCLLCTTIVMHYFILFSIFLQQ